ncbi:NfeD family protein [Leifsonia sp. TF02-11]|uniref:NfeD family protein n=1 Tax=Leifsonia sp. TF02-11 TaxID=2815212 RepID=UPI001AA191C2|nr:NfeD family protein [Leifsonia sp. TF02-11]MBN9631666.1 NfeD family protein [Actinomycetota bacterium]MBO1741074.1 NfeD family protein [Leifsonia sp. TF02-11]
MDITSFAWIAWLVLILVFVIIEMLTLDFVFLMIAVGSLGGLISGLFGAPWWLQLVIAAALSVVLLFFIRPPLLHRLKRGGDPTKSNVDALIGMSGVVVSTVSRTAGLVKLAVGETWTSRLATASGGPVELVPGEHVIVLSIEGATAVVAPSPVSAGADGLTERSIP